MLSRRTVLAAALACSAAPAWAQAPAPYEVDAALAAVQRLVDAGGSPDARIYDRLVDAAMRGRDFQRALQVRPRRSEGRLAARAGGPEAAH